MRVVQGPGGAALSADASTTGQTRLRLLVLVALGVVAMDQATKVVAVAVLEGRTVELAGGVLDLVLVRNTGAAFSLGTSFTVLLSLVAVAFLVVVVSLGRRTASTAWAVVLGLVAGGAAGNLVDRLARDPGPLRGAVVDFLRLPSWPVFNVADMAITGGAVVGVLLSVRGVGLDGQRDPVD